MHTAHDVVAFNCAREFLSGVLLKSHSLGDRDANAVLEKEVSVSTIAKARELPILYRQLLASSINTQRMPKVIAAALPTGHLDDLKPILDGFNPLTTARSFADGNAFWQALNSKVPLRRDVRLTNRSLWPRFCQSIVSGAQFLSQFSDAEDFYTWAQQFLGDERTRPALPLLIAAQVSGLGFALACDYLKELGFVEFGKPDIHLKDIFVGIGLCQERDDISVFNTIQRVAASNDVSPYTVDKLFWLIGSGSFNLANLKTGNKKRAFIEIMNRRVASQTAQYV